MPGPPPDLPPWACLALSLRGESLTETEQEALQHRGDPGLWQSGAVGIGDSFLLLLPINQGQQAVPPGRMGGHEAHLGLGRWEGAGGNCCNVSGCPTPGDFHLIDPVAACGKERVMESMIEGPWKDKRGAVLPSLWL